jgi:PAS domain S-box-containing protein
MAATKSSAKVPEPARSATSLETELLIECAQLLHSTLDPAEIVNILAERVCTMVRANVVLVLLQEDSGMQLRAAAASGEGTVERLNELYQRNGCGPANELARQVAEADELLCRRLDEDDPICGDIFPPGEVIAAPIRSARKSGALLVFALPRAHFSEQERVLASAMAKYAALAIRNAELYASARSHEAELQKLLDITGELASVGRIDDFLEKFVVRAAEFLGFERSYIALAEPGGARLRWGAEQGVARPLDLLVQTRLIERVLRTGEPFSTEDISTEPDAGMALIKEFDVKQYLLMPLLGSDGRSFGLLAVLDRRDKRPITSEDVRRARALAAEVAVVFEATHNLHQTEQHRRRAESLASLAQEVGASLRLPELARNFTLRAADLMGAGAVALALTQGTHLETVVLHHFDGEPERGAARRLNSALDELLRRHADAIITGDAEELLPTVGGALGWKDTAVARLISSDGELMGVLCIANTGGALDEEARKLLQAVVAQGDVAFENSRLFTRMAQANKHWMEIFDAITDFIVVHDAQNRVLRVNRSLADFIGLRPNDLIGVSMRALVSIASDITDGPCPFCRVGVGAADEYIHPALERTYLISTSKTHTGTHEGVQTIHVLKDITDRREAERRYRELFDNIQEGIFFSSPAGRFIEVNDALVRMFGYESREELLQVDIPNSLYVAPEHRERFKEEIEKQGAVRNYEGVYRRKDGAVIYTLQNSFAVRDSQGRIIQYRGAILDITDLKNFQGQLQRERDFNSKILNNTQSMILVADTAGLVSYANRRCFEAGIYKESDILGHRVTDLVSQVSRDDMGRAFEQTLHGHQVDNLELSVNRESGPAQFSVNLSPMRDEQGNVASIVIVMTDITDSVVLQSKLRHAEKMAAVGQLVSGVAHEVNNPLTAILGFSDLLLEQDDVPESSKKDIAVILQEAQRTKTIVQNLLSFARQTPPQRTAVQLNPILRRTVQLRAYDFGSHGVDVIENLAEDLPEIAGDPHQLQQVFLNIINNAYDAVCESGRAGRIELRTAVHNGAVEISFSDNGPGISLPERIFDPFFTTKEVGKGTGLGLSICYGIVHEHGGEISCHNNSPAPGATFVVRLPITRALAAAGGADA